MSLFLRCNQVGGSVTAEQPGALSPAGCTMHRFGQRFYHACVNVCRRALREIERAIAAFVSSGGGGLKASPKSGKRRESRPNTIFRKDRKRRCRGRALPIQYGSGFRYTQRVAALGADRRG